MNRIALLFVPSLIVLAILGCSRTRDTVAADVVEAPKYVALCRVDYNNMTGSSPISRSADVYCQCVKESNAQTTNNERAPYASEQHAVVSMCREVADERPTALATAH